MSLVEKFRPKTLDEIIGQEHVIKPLKEIAKRVREGERVNLLFCGPAGVGKTSTAMAFAREVFGENWRSYFIELNASDERGIDTVREKIKKIAESRVRRILFLDEADAMTQDAQQALRRIMEKSKNTIFILSCNWEYKIIDPIKSRCARFPFRPLKDEEIMKRLIEIIKKEQITVPQSEQTREALKLIVEIADGDMRKALNLLEEALTSKNGLTPESVLMLKKPEIIAQAIDYALNGDFSRAKQIVEEQFWNYDTKDVMREMYRHVGKINDEMVQIKLYEKLAELEYRLQVGSNPLVQIVGFLAWCWVVKHVPECPIMHRR